MSLMQRPILIATLTMFLFAASLGGALGVAMAKKDADVRGGFNVIGGPREPISPAKFLECVDDDSWVALYFWNQDNQWERYINPAKLQDADYVNEGDHAISTLPVGYGLYLLMESDEPLQEITLLDAEAEDCATT